MSSNRLLTAGGRRKSQAKSAASADIAKSAKSLAVVRRCADTQQTAIKGAAGEVDSVIEGGRKWSSVVNAAVMSCAAAAVVRLLKSAKPTPGLVQVSTIDMISM
eukprot:scaffold139794_cov33-Prasinocladus_malaysianus.AAC.1